MFINSVLCHSLSFKLEHVFITLVVQLKPSVGYNVHANKHLYWQFWHYVHLCFPYESVAERDHSAAGIYTLCATSTVYQALIAKRKPDGICNHAAH